MGARGAKLGTTVEGCLGQKAAGKGKNPPPHHYHSRVIGIAAPPKTLQLGGGLATSLPLLPTHPVGIRQPPSVGGTAIPGLRFLAYG